MSWIKDITAEEWTISWLLIVIFLAMGLTIGVSDNEVTWQSVGKMIFGIIIALGSIAALIYRNVTNPHDSPIELKWVLPFAVTMVWVFSWPALRDVASERFIGYTRPGHEPDVAFWASNWICGVGVLIFFFGGYYWFWKRDNY
jgi:hypothetical protein